MRAWRPALLAAVLATAGVTWAQAQTPRLTDATPAHLEVLGTDGRVAGTLTPLSQFEVVVFHAGRAVGSAAGTTSTNGTYSVAAGWDNGHFWGIHNGDWVQVTDQTTHRTYGQHVQLVGMLDEVTGLLTGTADPAANLRLTVYTNGNHATRVGTATITTDGAGQFGADLGALFHTSPPPGPHPWRGYVVNVLETDPGVTDRLVWRQLQTPNTVLVAERRLAGGGDFLAGQPVEFQLLRAGQVAATARTRADADGVPQAYLPLQVHPGDSLLTTYASQTGAARTQLLDPFQLTAQANVRSRRVAGVAEPGAPVVVGYYGPNGEQAVHTVAAADGGYSVSFPSMMSDRLVVVTQIADPGFTGVGAYQLELKTPWLTSGL